MYQILRHDYKDSEWFTSWHNLIVREHPDEVDTSMPVITGSDVLKEYVRSWMNRRQPGIYIGRGYVGNHMYKIKQLWRYSVNGFANTRLMPVSYSRWPIMNLVQHPWKVTEVKRVLIAPSKATSLIWDPQNGVNWIANIATKFSGAEVRIRYKPGKAGLRWSTLWSELDWADLVVAQASAITSEAFWFGKKVISLNPCITWAAGAQELEDWQNPKEPALREQWHEHLAWSQFTNQEWQSGEALKLIEQYVGPVMHYDPKHSYSFT
jgi:hypothetical protein